MPEYREPSYGESGPDLSREDVLVEEVPDVGRKNFYYDRSGNWRFGSSRFRRFPVSCPVRMV
jgi:hypothetical protein